MSKHLKPWTFEPFEREEYSTWMIFDDNLARIVAVFHNREDADEYLAWKNKKQAKKKAKKAKTPSWYIAPGAM